MLIDLFPQGDGRKTMTQRGASDIPQVRRSEIGDVDMAELGDTLTRKRPVWSTLSAKPKGAWRRQTFRMAIPIDQFWSTAAGFP